MSITFSEFLLSILTIAFGGWSAAVWRFKTSLDRIVNELAVMRSEQTHQTEELHALIKRLEKHEAKKAHDGAWEEIIKLKGQFQNMADKKESR